MTQNLLEISTATEIKALLWWMGQRTCMVVYSVSITKTCLYNVDLLKPHFYILVKLEYTEVYICFLISAQKTTIVGTR